MMRKCRNIISVTRELAETACDFGILDENNSKELKFVGVSPRCTSSSRNSFIQYWRAKKNVDGVLPIQSDIILCRVSGTTNQLFMIFFFSYFK